MAFTELFQKISTIFPTEGIGMNFLGVGGAVCKTKAFYEGMKLN